MIGASYHEFLVFVVSESICKVVFIFLVCSLLKHSNMIERDVSRKFECFTSTSFSFPVNDGRKFLQKHMMPVLVIFQSGFFSNTQSVSFIQSLIERLFFVELCR